MLATRFPAVRARLESRSRATEPAPPAAERVRVSLPAVATEAVVAEGEGVRVALHPRQARAARAEAEGGAVAYRDVYPETDALHVVKPDWTEEYLHLRSTRAPRLFEYDVLEASGATRVFVENGQVHFLDDAGKGLVALAPVVVDAIGRRSGTAARWSLQGEGGVQRLILSLDPGGLEYPLLVDPTWITTGSLNTARLDGIGILLHNGKVLVMAGAPNGQDTSELYDPATGVWTPAGAVGQGRAFFAAVLLRDGRVLLTGGSTSGPITAACRFFDPGTATWTAAPSMNSPRQSHTATLLADGRVLVAGGQNPLNTALASAEIFDPGTNTWTLTANMTNPHRNHGAARLADGRVLVAGGVTAGSLITSITEVFDPGAGTWTRVGDLGAVRTEISLTLLPNGRALAAAGGAATETAAADVFDPATGLWTPTGSLLAARSQHSATLLPSGRVLAAAGVSGSVLASSELYDAGAGTWSAGPNLSFGRFRHSATMLPDGRVLVAGGFNAVALFTAELLDVDNPSWTGTASMSANRPEATATLLKDGRVLVTGGVGLNTAEVYNPVGPSWTPTANNLSAQRWRHTATALVNGRVLVAGGSGTATGSAELYDPPTNSWLATGSMAGGRSEHTATLLPCGEVLVAGGYLDVRNAERYTPRTGKWRATGSLNTGRYRHTATLLKDGRVLVTGGWSGGSPTASAEVYDPTSETWIALASTMSAGRYHHDATLLPSGKVLITGGSFAAGTADLFDPATNTFTATGGLVRGRDTGFSATLLPNGRVLIVGGFTSPTRAEVYDPAVGLWTAAPDVPTGHDGHVAALLPDGRVLVAGGSASSAAEVYDVGRGENPGWRPLLFTATDPLVRGTPLAITGNNLTGLGEGSTGLGYMHSATNYPLVQLRRLDNDLVGWLPVDPAVGWSSTGFRSTDVTGAFGAAGLAIATVFTNGIPSVSKGLSIECPAPLIVTPPTSQSVCQGAAVNFVASVAGADCPVYQWRRNSVSLVEGPPFAGTDTTSLSISPAGLAQAGSYDLQVSLACSSTVVTSAAATLTVNPPIGAVDASISGPASVCTTCLGGIASEAHTGGGAVTHQWGYRTISLGAITDIPFATSPTYVLSGADFPVQGNYFLVVKVTAACGGLVISDEVPVTVANTPGPADEVPFFTVTSRASRNVLEWVYPATPTIRIRYTTGSPCVYPADAISGTLLLDRSGTAGMTDSVAHDPATNGTTYCYRIFVDTTGGGTWTTGKTNSGKPFPTAGPLKWAFHSGMFSTTAPTVGSAGILATNNDNAVHAMTRGPGGGEWPAGWKPVMLGGAVQNRSPIVPITVGGSNPVVFLGAQDGFVYAVDGTTGGAAASPWPGPAAAGGRVQAAPAGLFTAFGGDFNYLLVGTREASANNVFKAFNPANGNLLATFDNGGGTSGIGIISSMAAVDYAADPDRVYFTSHARAGGSANTLWCLELLAAPGVFNLVWARDDLGDIESAPVLRGGRVYVGSTNGGGTLYSINAATGSSADDRTYLHGDGPVKGFVFPDRNSPTGDVYFAANTRVWGVTEIGSVLDNRFGAGIPLPGGAIPQTLLFHPGSHYIYVGDNVGRFLQIDSLTGSVADAAVQLGASPLTLGAPSLDIGHGLVHIGSEPGTFFAIEVPLPACVASCAGQVPGTPCSSFGLSPCTDVCLGSSLGDCSDGGGG